MRKIGICFWICLAAFILLPQPVFAMHIMEGFLPLKWCIIWDVLSLPFIILGLMSIQRITKNNPKLKMLIALAGAFAFVLSALKLPSITGSSSHPTGVGLGAILFGPMVMAVLGSIVLLFQALLLAHGGLSTLGANLFAMGIVGPISAYVTYKLLNRFGAKKGYSVFFAASTGNLLTYITTSFQLALAFQSATQGFMFLFLKFLGVFAITQIPLAISEGLLTVLIFNFLSVYSFNELKELQALSEENINEQV